jgi:hypothetical protein
MTEPSAALGRSNARGDNLERQNAELVAALHAIIDLDHTNMGPESRATEIARAALAKATQR